MMMVFTSSYTWVLFLISKLNVSYPSPGLMVLLYNLSQILSKPPRTVKVSRCQQYHLVIVLTDMTGASEIFKLFLKYTGIQWKILA